MVYIDYQAVIISLKWPDNDRNIRLLWSTKIFSPAGMSVVLFSRSSCSEKPLRSMDNYFGSLRTIRLLIKN